MGRSKNNLSNFTRHFFRYTYHVRTVLFSLLLMVGLGGVAISYLENLELGTSLYFAFVTGLSIGYGDVSPVTPLGRVVAVGIGMIGMLFTGMSVAVATRALAASIKQNPSDW